MTAPREELGAMTAPTEAVEDPQTLRARARLGAVLQEKWTLDALLGVGGMAAVYAATHRNGKRVAVKVLHAEFGYDPEIRSRFLQEGYAANAIEHEGAVSVLDDDVAADGSAFLVMELLTGETVEARWERSGRRLPAPEVLFIADQVLDVLAAAHDRNVIHRDIKPENLFITQAGSLKVLDFGIARVFEARDRHATATRAGMVMGTPAFMAPEQARARWDEVDARTDLWAVGATMFTLLAGRTVHEAESSHEQLIMGATQPAPPLASVAAGAPIEVVSIVDRALAFDRDARWPTARDMQRAVRAALEAVGGGGPALKAQLEVDPPSRARAPERTAAVLRAPADDSPTAPASSGVSATSTWIRERETRLTEIGRLRATLADLERRFEDAKSESADAQARVEAAHAERQSLERWFEQRVGTRAATIEAAERDRRGRLAALGRRVTANRAAWGGSVDAECDAITRLDLALVSAERDAAVHEAALAAYDRRRLRSGLVVLGLAALLLLVLMATPVVWRAEHVVRAPPARSAR